MQVSRGQIVELLRVIDAKKAWGYVSLRPLDGAPRAGASGASKGAVMGIIDSF